jgi:hypothetical protein
MIDASAQSAASWSGWVSCSAASWRILAGGMISGLGGFCNEEAMGWMGSNLVESSPGARGGCKPRARTWGHGVAVFPTRPSQSFGGLGQLGAVAVG